MGIVIHLVTLENKVNSNSDQFKFVQLSSKSGWSLTKGSTFGVGGSDLVAETFTASFALGYTSVT